MKRCLRAKIFVCFHQESGEDWLNFGTRFCLVFACSVYVIYSSLFIFGSISTFFGFLFHLSVVMAFLGLVGSALQFWMINERAVVENFRRDTKNLDDFPTWIIQSSHVLPELSSDFLMYDDVWPEEDEGEDRGIVSPRG